MGVGRPKSRVRSEPVTQASEPFLSCPAEARRRRGLHSAADPLPRRTLHVVDALDLGDELDRLTVPLDGGDVVGFDLGA